MTCGFVGASREVMDGFSSVHGGVWETVLTLIRRCFRRSVRWVGLLQPCVEEGSCIRVSSNGTRMRQVVTRRRPALARPATVVEPG